ncbi:MAG: Nif3-like dinuclear metal center hexameric protein [Desulfobacterales bacterium]|nr:Nif3-like dinuclear metal center hexameric protein [Desulfobacterales bacterium]
MTVMVGDVIKLMEQIAPSSIAEEWDNTGLQVGQINWPVHNIWIALDATPQVVESACKENVSLLITHHPLIFKPLKNINFSDPIGRIIYLATLHKLAIFSAHTNLDIVSGGVNDVLANAIGLKNLKVLSKKIRDTHVKLVCYIPVEYEQKILDAIFEKGVGKIGDYTCCSFRNHGIGSFKPGEATNPFKGKSGEIFHADEIRLELVLSNYELNDVISAIKKIHPYETMAYDVYPIKSIDISNGIGRIGELHERMTLHSLAISIKEKLKLHHIKISGDLELNIEKVAVCSGSGSSLIKDFLKSDAQVYVSSDFKYHDARNIEDSKRGLIDIGHFASESLILKVLSEKLKNLLDKAEYGVFVKDIELEEDPFKFF